MGTERAIIDIIVMINILRYSFDDELTRRKIDRIPIDAITGTMENLNTMTYLHASTWK